MLRVMNAAGCSRFTRVSGEYEPLLRSDFQELYRYARSLGLIPILFTNATLITPDLAAFLAANPPRRVEITVYGHTRETYERVTGVPGSFNRFRAGVAALRGLPAGAA